MKSNIVKYCEENPEGSLAGFLEEVALYTDIDRLTDDEAALVQAGEPQDWLKETHAICVGIYEDSPEGTKISYDYVDKYTPVIEQQLVRGGYRLARLLNEIYR